MNVTQASGWDAVFVDEETEELSIYPVLLWAVTFDPEDAHGIRLVDGMITNYEGTIDLCQAFHNFVGFKLADEPISEYPQWAVQDALSLMKAQRTW